MFFVVCFLASIIKAGLPEDLLAQMTLQEKAGQTLQCERGTVNADDIKQYTPGSVFSAGGSVPSGNNPKAWTDMITEFQNAALQTRLKIPIIYGIDAVHGNNNILGSTIFPHNSAYGAATVGDFNTGIKNAQEEGAAVAEELRATGNHWTFAPVLGNPQDIRWGRTYEGFSENISIPAACGSAYFKGLHGDGTYYNAEGTMKHYIGEGQTTNGQNGGNANLSEEQLQGLLEPYAACIKAGALSLMPSFSSVNNIHCTAHKHILTDLLKDQLGFEGFVVSDYQAVYGIEGSESYGEKCVRSLNAGLDMFMTAGKGSYVDAYNAVIDGVNKGTLPLARLDDAVLRILRAKEKLGLFAKPLPDAPGQIGTAPHRATARRHAADSFVLLKNENNIIGKLAGFQNILVTGQGGDDIGMQCGGWTTSWQGGHGNEVPGTSIIQGLKNAGKTVTYAANGNVPGGNFDVIIAVIGEDPYSEGDGDRGGNIGLRGTDNTMLQNIYNSNLPKVVVMLAGRPMHLGDEPNRWDAFVQAWLPGSEGGDALADVLVGERDFVGALSYTWRKSNGGEVQWPYGFGLKKNN